MKIRRGVFPTPPYEVTECIPGSPTTRLAREGIAPAPSERMARFAMIYQPVRHRNPNLEV